MGQDLNCFSPAEGETQVGGEELGENKLSRGATAENTAVESGNAPKNIVKDPPTKAGSTRKNKGGRLGIHENDGFDGENSEGNRHIRDHDL